MGSNQCQDHAADMAGLGVTVLNWECPGGVSVVPQTQVWGVGGLHKHLYWVGLLEIN